MAFILLKIFIAQGVSSLLELNAGFCYLAPLLDLEVYVNENLIANSLKSLLWPFCEPVNGATIYQRREVSNPISERISDRTHGQDHVQISLSPLYEIIFIVFMRSRVMKIQPSCSLGNDSEIFLYPHFLVLVE